MLLCLTCTATYGYIKVPLQDTLLKQDSVVSKLIQPALDPDSLKQDTTIKTKYTTIPDSISGDTTEFSVDTVKVVGGVFPLVKEKYLEQKYFGKDDTLKVKKVKIERPFSALAMQRSPIFKKDTISFSKIAMFSLFAPGFGQLYNKQYWKIPVLYAGVGGFAAYGIVASHKYKDAKVLYDNALYGGSPQEEITSYRSEMDKYKTQKSIMIAGAAITYMYFLSDAIINYKGEVHPTRKATMLSALFPGAGQLYNKKYWKLPIIYGGFATFGYIVNYNNTGYKRFKLAYELLTDGNDATKDEFDGYYTASQLQNTRDSYRRYRDLGLILTAGFYILQIIDAHVDAYLARYDVSDNLALRVEPTYEEAPRLSKRPTGGGIMGVGMKLRF